VEDGRKSHAPSIGKTASVAGSVDDDDDLEENLVPDFQRVYISGEDTTGVRFRRT